MQFAYLKPPGGQPANFQKNHVRIPNAANRSILLTKADLIDVVASEAELSKRQAGEIVDLVLEEIKAALQKGDRVALTPFGSFVVRHRKAREGRNPKTGDKIKIAARKVPAFVAGKGLKDAVGGVKKAATPVKKAAAKKKPAGKKKVAKKR